MAADAVDLQSMEWLAMGDLWSLVPSALGLIGALAMTVMVITEVIKEMPPFSLIRTSYVVTVLSIALSVGCLFAWADWVERKLQWYLVCGAVIGGFFVAFISMFGWEKFQQMWEKLRAPQQLTRGTASKRKVGMREEDE